ncbi:MAG: hypothetical protein WD607_07185, partial [Candidatus Paceibacterota bacterium]
TSINIYGDIVFDDPNNNVVNEIKNVDRINGVDFEELNSVPGHEILSNSKNTNIDWERESDSVSVSCSAGKIVIGGGCSIHAGNNNYNLRSSNPYGPYQWACSYVANRDGAGSATIVAYAICASE